MLSSHTLFLPNMHVLSPSLSELPGETRLLPGMSQSNRRLRIPAPSKVNPFGISFNTLNFQACEPRYFCSLPGKLIFRCF